MAPLLHALMITSNALPAEESKKENFKNYAYSFQDAKQSQEYVTCLERNRKAADFKKRYRSANQWLKRSREAMQNYKTHFTPNEQITDVIESYTDIDEAHGNHHVVVTRQDGTQVVIDTQFKKLPN
jgi:hypothetical protein